MSWTRPIPWLQCGRRRASRAGHSTDLLHACLFVQTQDVEKGSIGTYRVINHSPGLQHVQDTLFLNNITLIPPPQNHNARLLQLLSIQGAIHPKANTLFFEYYTGLIEICECEAASHNAKSEHSMWAAPVTMNNRWDLQTYWQSLGKL